MKVGIFSDIHDNIGNLEKALKIFSDEKIKLGFFCGDLVSPLMIKWLAEWPFEIKAVKGNNEGDWSGIIRRFDKYKVSNIEYSTHALTWQGELEGKSIIIFHGNNIEILEALISCGKYDLVCSGHDHEPKIKRVQKTLWINPGSVTGFSENPKIKVGSVSVCDLVTMQARIIELR